MDAVLETAEIGGSHGQVVERTARQLRETHLTGVDHHTPRTGDGRRRPGRPGRRRDRVPKGAASRAGSSGRPGGCPAWTIRRSVPAFADPGVSFHSAAETRPG